MYISFINLLVIKMFLGKFIFKLLNILNLISSKKKKKPQKKKFNTDHDMNSFQLILEQYKNNN
jgi:hypothetical protein